MPASTGKVPPAGVQSALNGCAPFFKLRVVSMSTNSLYSVEPIVWLTTEPVVWALMQSRGDRTAGRFAQQCSIWVCGYHLRSDLLGFPGLSRTAG